MKFLLWLERHLAWVHFYTHEVDTPVIDELHGQAARSVPAATRTKRTILLNIGTSVGGAVIIGVLSGVIASQRLSQSTADALNAHDARLSTLESKIVPRKEIEEKSNGSKEQVNALNQRLTDTREQMNLLQTQLNTILLEREHKQ